MSSEKEEQAIDFFGKFIGHTVEHTDPYVTFSGEEVVEMLVA